MIPEKNRREKVERARALTELTYRKATNDLGTFFRGAWNVLEPSTDLLANWHQDLICEYLVACHLRQIKRLIINLPPRNLKSNIVTVAFPCWVWQKEPEERFITASYADTLASKHSVDRRTLIQSDWYQSGFGSRFKVSPDQNEKTKFTNDKRGQMLATGIHGGIIGEGGNIIIIDDPHDAKKVYSDTQRAADNQAFDQKFTTRLDDKNNGVIIVVMQRLHEQDLTGHLLEKGGWEHLCLPAIATSERMISFPVSHRKILREEGSYLHEEREGESALAQAKIDLGSADFSAQYQQNPTPPGGNMINPAWWKRYDSKDMPVRFDQLIQSWDMTFKDTKNSDFVVGQCWGRIGAKAYLMPIQIRGRLDIIKTIDGFKRLTLSYPLAHLKIVEDKANGPAVISLLKSKISGIVPYTPTDSKVGRLSAVLPMIEAGNVYLPSKEMCPWIDAFIDECSKFPEGAQDDQVDAMTQALIRFFEASRYDLEKLTQM